MDTRTESPYWLAKNGFLDEYSSLTENTKADFAIIGGGISGAILAWTLARRGADVIVLEAKHLGLGSTAASTALVQYDLDVTLADLSKKIGEAKAARCYQLSLDAVERLSANANRLTRPSLMEARESFRFAHFKKDIPMLEREFEIRKKYGFDVELWDERKIREKFGATFTGGLVTRPSAVVDPLKLTHAFLRDARRKGARLFDNTHIGDIERSARSVSLKTRSGHSVTARKIVIACGYEAAAFLPFKVAALSSTYAFASEPLPNGGDLWHKNASFWTTGDPYLYARTTPDNRIIVGGGDEPFYSPKKRDRLLMAKSKSLAAKFGKFFPEIDLKIDYRWAGTFVDTEDGLPFIGSVRQLPHTYFTLGYGGNGITFSQLAADILADLLTGKKNADARMFAFDRPTD